MKPLLLCLALWTLGLSTSAADRTDFPLHRGINMSHWLSQVPDQPVRPRSAYVTERDVRLLRAAGFDHLRLPVDEIELWDDQGERIPEAWDYLARFLDWCQDNDLRVILDLHTVRSHHFNAINQGEQNTLFSDSAEQEAFVGFWEQLIDAVGHHDTGFLAYEMLNESVAEDDEDWNQLVNRAIERIRQREPERVLVVGSNRWQDPAKVPALRLPEDDPNLIISFHFYSPFLFTHYAASWTPLREYEGPIQYPGVPVPEKHLSGGDYSQRFLEHWNDGNAFYDRHAMRADIVPAVRSAAERGLRLYCGEFGAMKTVAREQMLRWYSDVVQVFDSLEIPYTAWDYQGTFGMVDPATGGIDHELLDILVGRPAEACE